MSWKNDIVEKAMLWKKQCCGKSDVVEQHHFFHSVMEKAASCKNLNLKKSSYFQNFNEMMFRVFCSYEQRSVLVSFCSPGTLLTLTRSGGGHTGPAHWKKYLPYLIYNPPPPHDTSWLFNPTTCRNFEPFFTSIYCSVQFLWL